MNIVIDMMGGDNGIKSTIPAIKKIIDTYSNINLYCVGDLALLNELNSYSPRVHIIPSLTVLKMDVDPMSALKDKDSSLSVAIKTLLDNDFDAIISAGSTGALVSSSIFKIKRINGVKRPALVTSLPTLLGDKKVVVLDLGANIECDEVELNQFAILGSLFYKSLYKVKSPKVFALNIGEEEEKGKEVNKKAYKLLKENNLISFEGNIEGREVLTGFADVIVTDGYSGNIFLKSTEGAIKSMSKLLKEVFLKNLVTKLSYLGVKDSLKEMKTKLDYKKVGGALLLGVNKIVVKAHGNSDEYAFFNAIELTIKLIENNLLNEIKEAFK